LWFRKRTIDDIVLLDVLADRTPELADVTRLFKSLEHSKTTLCVVVNMSQVTLGLSRLLASLVSLWKEVLEVNGRLVLCSLRPALRRTFGYTRLTELFDIFETEEDAVGALRAALD